MCRGGERCEVVELNFSVSFEGLTTKESCNQTIGCISEPAEKTRADKVNRTYRRSEITSKVPLSKARPKQPQQRCSVADKKKTGNPRAWHREQTFLDVLSPARINGNTTEPYLCGESPHATIVHHALWTYDSLEEIYLLCFRVSVWKVNWTSTWLFITHYASRKQSDHSLLSCRISYITFCYSAPLLQKVPSSSSKAPAPKLDLDLSTRWSI